MTHWFSYTRSGPLVTISPLYYKRELLIFYFHLYISSIVKDLLLSIPACDAVAKIVNFPTALQPIFKATCKTTFCSLFNDRNDKYSDMQCPKCSSELLLKQRYETSIDYCPSCGGLCTHEKWNVIDYLWQCRPSHTQNSLYITLLSNTQMVRKNQFTLNLSNSSFRSRSLPCVFVSDSAAISRLQSHQLLIPIKSLSESRSLLHIPTNNNTLQSKI